MSLDHLIAGLRASSLSDTMSYRRLCAVAAEDEQVFRSFRRNPHYTRILEHVTEAQGRQYLDEVRRSDERLLSYPQWFKANDEQGNPVLHEYADIGHVSPTTLRYVKVLADLRELFGGAVSGRRVVEIGGGYGGQARIYCGRDVLVSRYTIVDLPEPLLLAQKFLSAYTETSARVDYIDGLKFASTPDTFIHDSNLFISNYALTECAPDVMRAYVERIALNCAQGYITGNAQQTLLFKLLASKDPVRFEERPRTGEGNFICVWGAK